MSMSCTPTEQNPHYAHEVDEHQEGAKRCRTGPCTDQIWAVLESWRGHSGTGEVEGASLNLRAQMERAPGG